MTGNLKTTIIKFVFKFDILNFSLVINASEHPLPSICRTDQISDWFESLGNCLYWNQRKKQFPLDSTCFTEKINSGQRDI